MNIIPSIYLPIIVEGKTSNENLFEVIKEKKFSTQLIISGSHYSKIFGKTAKEITYKKKCLFKKIQISQFHIQSNTQLRAYP